MELSEFLKLAITGLLTGTITYFFTVKNIKLQFNNKLLENLYEKRYQTYIRLLEITQDLGKKETNYQDHKKARLDLIEWQKTSGGFLLLSEETLESFYELKNLLKKDKSIKQGYTPEFLEKIFFARNKLRGNLRKEFKFLHLAEKKI